jgi:hypothetical protein
MGKILITLTMSILGCKLIDPGFVEKPERKKE